jgi:hypothetical protein
MTPKELTEVSTALDFLVQRSNANYFEDDQVLKLTLWLQLNRMKMEQLLPKLLKSPVTK